jgi:hypothetical protein
LIKIIILFFVFISLSYSSSIGTITGGKIDRFEHAYALVTRGDQVITVEDLGFKIKKNDTIKTFRKSKIKITLKDSTIIKIGKRSTLKIEKYLYNANNSAGNVANLKVENGTFQIKTGKIGDSSPKNFKIKTKFSTIGLRG